MEAAPPLEYQNHSGQQQQCAGDTVRFAITTQNGADGEREGLLTQCIVAPAQLRYMLIYHT